MAQRRGFREYLAGLLAPRERNKTLTTLARAEPLTGAKLSAVQRLQFFLSESVWDPERVNDRRLELLLAAPLTELGWADFQVRSDIAIRHQALVNCAFSFCWAAALPPPGAAQAAGREGTRPASPSSPGRPELSLRHQAGPPAARRPQLADPRDHAHTLVARLVPKPPLAEPQHLLDDVTAGHGLFPHPPP